MTHSALVYTLLSRHIHYYTCLSLRESVVNVLAQKSKFFSKFKPIQRFYRESVIVRLDCDIIST